MPVTVAILREDAPGERRLALVPALVAKYAALGATLLFERGAGLAAGLPDKLFKDCAFGEGDAVLAGADLVLCVQAPAPERIAKLKRGAVVVGTIRPAKALVIGAGVAGLQAIATARRLGAVVEAYDVRAAAREQVQSLGARFVDIPIQAEGAGGYARELTPEERAEQQRILAEHVAAADLVICTAAVPGRPAPKIITAEMVAAMRPGSVIVDLAAESGGNCELTTPGEDTVHDGVTVSAPLNVPSRLAAHASEMYARNLYNFTAPLFADGTLRVDWDDEVYGSAVVVRDGRIGGT
ncbi:MAG: NAD(P)(+) transhydrogenase (Re/Si-specific) subunit alpha [Xanthomonadaceae bacterium]|nr:NAD(P)(+) transhydrogenase (Re/Si-specific) subunit alpha [Xanthomonadaceae bacterium]